MHNEDWVEESPQNMKRSSAKVPRKGQCKKYPGNTSVKNSQEEPVQKSTQEGQVQKIPGKTYNTSFLTEAQPDISFFSTEIVLQCKTNDIFNFLCLLINLLMRERLTPNLIGDSGVCRAIVAFWWATVQLMLLRHENHCWQKKTPLCLNLAKLKNYWRKKRKRREREKKGEKGRKGNCATHVVWSREQLLAKKTPFVFSIFVFCTADNDHNPL